MKVAKPEVMKALSKATLRKQLTACKKLLKGYESGEGMDHCPLCGIGTLYECETCPWVYIRGFIKVGIMVPCSKFARSIDISRVRDNPKAHPKQVKLRIKQLKFWIEVIQEEIKRDRRVK